MPVTDSSLALAHVSLKGTARFSTAFGICQLVPAPLPRMQRLEPQLRCYPSAIDLSKSRHTHWERSKHSLHSRACAHAHAHEIFNIPIAAMILNQCSHSRCQVSSAISARNSMYGLEVQKNQLLGQTMCFCLGISSSDTSDLSQQSAV